MQTKHFLARGLAWMMILVLAIPPGIIAQQAQTNAVFEAGRIRANLGADRALSHSLVAQILMASTYPLEVVQADRFAKQNASLKGEALTKALEAQIGIRASSRWLIFPRC